MNARNLNIITDSIFNQTYVNMYSYIPLLSTTKTRFRQKTKIKNKYSYVKKKTCYYYFIIIISIIWGCNISINMCS